MKNVAYCNKCGNGFTNAKFVSRIFETKNTWVETWNYSCFNCNRNITIEQHVKPHTTNTYELVLVKKEEGEEDSISSPQIVKSEKSILKLIFQELQRWWCK